MQYDVNSAVATADGTMVAYRTRVKGVVLTTNGTAGSAIFKNGGASGTALITLNTPGSTSMHDVLLPGEGVLFSTDVYVDVTNVTSVTIFYG